MKNKVVIPAFFHRHHILLSFPYPFVIPVPCCHSRILLSFPRKRESGYAEPMKSYFVYLLTNHTRTTLYIGVTNDLKRRIYEHKNGLVEGFAEKYRLYYLVYFEETNDIYSAIEREKQLKKWNRKWKDELIEETNPEWNDLSNGWFE